MSSDILEQAKIEFQAGKVAFERGEYRQSVQNLEKARELVDRNSRLGGEILIWLVTAYEAADQRTEALALCRILTNHPHIETRKQSKRLLSILEAPKLRSRPEWLVEIPDLTGLEESENNAKGAGGGTSNSKPKSAQKSENEPLDLSQVNTKDNLFIWLTLIMVIITVAGLFYFAQT